jgi:hypothetical protein
MLKRARPSSTMTWRARTDSGARRVHPGGREQEGERGCARGVIGSGRGRWREDESRGGRSARGDKAEHTPARCSMQRRLLRARSIAAERKRTEMQARDH